MKMLLLGDAFPNFTARTTHGTIDFHKWIDTDWAVLFSHPSDFTPVCTTELAQLVKLMPQFRQRGVKVIGLSCDSIASHTEWCKDINFYAGNSDSCETPFPLIDDSSRKIANLLGMLDKDELDGSGLPLTARAVFIVDSNKKFRLSILYPATTGRNFGEILRVLDSLILADKYKVATPVDWKQGQDCMVLPNVPEDQINLLFPRGVTTHPLPSGKPYLRQTPCPEPTKPPLKLGNCLRVKSIKRRTEERVDMFTLNKIRVIQDCLNDRLIQRKSVGLMVMRECDCNELSKSPPVRGPNSIASPPSTVSAISRTVMIPRELALAESLASFRAPSATVTSTVTQTSSSTSGMSSAIVITSNLRSSANATSSAMLSSAARSSSAARTSSAAKSSSTGISVTASLEMPLSDVNMPSSDENMPSPDVNMPSSDVNMSSSDEDMPSPDVNMPSSDVNMPSSDEDMPSSDEDMLSPIVSKTSLDDVTTVVYTHRTRIPSKKGMTISAADMTSSSSSSAVPSGTEKKSSLDFAAKLSSDSAGALESSMPTLPIGPDDDMPTLQNTLPELWKKTLHEGVCRDTIERMRREYRRPLGFEQFEAPILNPETAAALDASAVQSDRNVMLRQQILTASLLPLAQAYKMLDSNNYTRDSIMKPVNDAALLICENHFRETNNRRNSAIDLLNENFRNALNEIPRDRYLLGTNLVGNIDKIFTSTPNDNSPPTTD